MKRIFNRSNLILAGTVALFLTWSIYHADRSSVKPNTAITPGERRFQQHYDGQRLDRFWTQALREEYKAPGELLAQNEREQRKGIFYRKLIRGNAHFPAVALTFDDGPHPLYTPKLLKILQQYHVKATFFVVGKMAEKYPDLLKAEAAAGHLIGNHTYHHVNLTRIPPAEAETEWLACNDVVKSITGYQMQYCRPPGGDYNTEVITAAMRAGLTTVLWTDDPGDYANPGEAVLMQRILKHINNGGIILLHDGSKQTIDLLPQIITFLHRQGYQLQTVDEMVRTIEK